MPKRAIIASSLTLAVTLGQSTVHSQAQPAYRGWPAYGGGPESIRYSSLDEPSGGVYLAFALPRPAGAK